MENQPSLIALYSHELFNQLSQEDLDSLTKIVEVKTFEPGEMVFDANMRPDYLFMVEEGKFQLQLHDNTLKDLLPGEIFGEIGIINKDFRSGTVKAIEKSRAGCIRGEKLFDKTVIRPELSLIILRTLAKIITTYLRTKEQVTTEEIIENGESDQVEFKSTLRWNLFTNKKDAKIEHAALKTIAAFLNTRGGILLIGVADDGEVLGLENDHFPNHDKFLLHFTKLIKDKIGTTFVSYLNTSIETIREKEVLRIDCQPASKPAYLTDGAQDYFYIRTGPSTTAMRLSKVYGYIRERFFQE